MKARGRRLSAFIVFECSETPMKHEARVFEIASPTKKKISLNYHFNKFSQFKYVKM